MCSHGLGCVAVGKFNLGRVLWGLGEVIHGKHFIFYLFIFLSFVFLGPHLQHMEVPWLGVELKQLLAYATAIAALDPSRVCDLHHSSPQCWIPNPLSKARDGTQVLMDIVRFINHWATMGTPWKNFIQWQAHDECYLFLFEVSFYFSFIYTNVTREGWHFPPKRIFSHDMFSNQTKVYCSLQLLGGLASGVVTFIQLVNWICLLKRAKL